MATNFVSYRTFSLGAEVSQDPLDRSLHHTVGIELQIINPTFFLRYLKERYHVFCYYLLGGDTVQIRYVQTVYFYRENKQRSSLARYNDVHKK